MWEPIATAPSIGPGISWLLASCYQWRFMSSRSAYRSRSNKPQQRVLSSFDFISEDLCSPGAVRGGVITRRRPRHRLDHVR